MSDGFLLTQLIKNLIEYFIMLRTLAKCTRNVVIPNKYKILNISYNFEWRFALYYCKMLHSSWKPYTHHRNVIPRQRVNILKIFQNVLFIILYRIHIPVIVLKTISQTTFILYFFYCNFWRILTINFYASIKMR